METQALVAAEAITAVIMAGTIMVEVAVEITAEGAMIGQNREEHRAN